MAIDLKREYSLPNINYGGEGKKIVLSTLPEEGQFVNWTTPTHFKPKATVYMPLGILSLASNLDYNKHDITVLDPSSEGWSVDETVKRIEDLDADVIGFSAVDRKVWALREILKRTSAPYKIIGGPHVTAYGSDNINYGTKLLHEGLVDAVFAGQLADNEFREAMEYPNGQEPKGFIDCTTHINDTVFPKREFLDINRYFQTSGVFKFGEVKRLPLYSSVGCPQKCTFCNVQLKQPQLRDAKTIVDEMEYLKSIGVTSAHILDDNFNIIPKHLENIAEEMGKRGYNSEWSGRGQARMTPESRYGKLQNLKQFGFRRIHAGIEALDDKILQWMRKPETEKDIKMLSEKMSEADIEILGYFITGNPPEVEKEGYIESLPSQIRSLGIAHPFFNVLYPEPNTPYYRDLVSHGIYEGDLWDNFFNNPSKDFEIPYPYGNGRRDEVMGQVQWLIDEFDTKVVDSIDSMDVPEKEETHYGVEEKRPGMVRQE
jgi:anaerobic magnesium-protoporphyrin IX monomethyl ester cyclase